MDHPCLILPLYLSDSILYLKLFRRQISVLPAGYYFIRWESKILSLKIVSFFLSLRQYSREQAE